MHLTCQDVTYKDGLRHEGEVLCPPEVAIVHTSHEDVREEDDDVLVNLEPEGVEQAVRADEVPVKAPRKQAHSFVVASSTEDIAEDGAVVVGKAEDGDAGKQGEHPLQRDGWNMTEAGDTAVRLTLRNDLPDKHN